jgi:hypothetical protein
MWTPEPDHETERGSAVISRGCIRRQLRRRGGAHHVRNHHPVVTPGRSTGDFEGCARPSQPTIGIAAEPAQSGWSGQESRHPGGATRRAVAKQKMGPGSNFMLQNAKWGQARISC